MRERSDHSFAKQIPIGRQKTVSYCVFRLTNHVSFYNVRHENNKAVKMVLESTMVCVDTSEYMRNGDFIPTRFQAQQDAVNLVCHSKTRSNPENTVGLLTLANVKVLATLTTDVGKLLGSLHQIQPKGDISFSTAVKVAHRSVRCECPEDIPKLNCNSANIAVVTNPVFGEAPDLTLVSDDEPFPDNVDVVDGGTAIGTFLCSAASWSRDLVDPRVTGRSYGAMRGRGVFFERPLEDLPREGML
uniref:26S proteasome non-ATPase regulatory subunit 4-like n=1 Tax=Saccoglossus kowalevskii TaxID=10224 RepID=A0ABM0MC31_SACKO|nr:PREDICTED: 26S proteasome non-ATPase regulatory subunit 4-like [Saccoglossus kowalevskii]